MPFDLGEFLESPISTLEALIWINAGLTVPQQPVEACLPDRETKQMIKIILVPADGPERVHTIFNSLWRGIA
jgi:hypothetical protein